MTRDVLIGIDIGSTSIRSCVFDIQAKLLKEAACPTESIHIINKNPGDANRLWDAQLLWQRVCEVTREISSYLSLHHFHPLAIATSSVGCSPVLLDNHNNPLLPVVRHHSGSSLILRKYWEKKGELDFRNISGYPLAETSTAFLLADIKESAPDIYSKIDCILPVASYIGLRMTGERISDRSIAASFGLWDHRNNSWWIDLLNDLDLEPGCFGKVVDGGLFIGKILPEIAEITGLPVNLPVYSGGHDYLCAALASGCFQPGEIFNIEGTFEIAATFHSGPVHISQNDSMRSIIDIHVVPDVYSLMVERVGAGQVEWLKDLLFPSKKKHSNDWEKVFSAVEKISDDQTRNEIFIPYIYGMLFPSYNDRIRGGFMGWDKSTTRESIMRSAIFSHCFESRRMIGYQKAISSEKINQIVTVGGITRSTYWMQQKANIIGLNIKVPNIMETSALGAALLAGLGAGIYQNLDQLKQITQSKGFSTYEPDPSRVDYYSEYFQNIYLPVLKQAGVIDEYMEKNPIRS